jgi:hypothetical protein
MKLLKILGVIFVLLILAGGSLYGYMTHQHDKHLGPVLQKVKGLLADLPQRESYEYLGTFLKCPKGAKNNTLQISAFDPFRTYFQMECEFENAEVQVQVKLEKHGEWIIKEFNVLQRIK